MTTDTRPRPPIVATTLAVVSLLLSYGIGQMLAAAPVAVRVVVAVALVAALGVAAVRTGWVRR